jgi:predicted transcriptional regulator
MPFEGELSRREREILNAVYKLGRASAADVRNELKRPPTYTAVRTHLTNLEAKGLVRFTADGKKYIYEPAVPREEVAEDALKGVLETFFESKVELVVSTLLSSREKKLSKEELDRLAEMIQTAKEEGNEP